MTAESQRPIPSIETNMPTAKKGTKMICHVGVMEYIIMIANRRIEAIKKSTMLTPILAIGIAIHGK